MEIQPYLVFNDNCREAFEFYAKTLKGKIESLLTFADVPPNSGMPPCADDQKDKVMHARLVVGEAVVMGSDAPQDHYKKPVGVSVSLQINDVAEAERVYKELSAGSNEIMMPIGQTFWAARFAMFNDRYGTPWMINCNPAA